jgi:NAD(P)-dependent dehydrogenase (short-subunit alcohol dehydrogenase family)
LTDAHLPSASALSLFDLTGQVALVTGTGGLGQPVASALAAAGATVVVAAVTGAGGYRAARPGLGHGGNQRRFSAKRG